MLKLGITACLHGDSKAAESLAKTFATKKCHALIMAGDLNSDERPAGSLKEVLKAALKAFKNPLLVIPGSHEPVKAYTKVIKELSRYKNLKDCSKKKKIELKGYELLFLPGSDWLSSEGGFKFSGKKEKLRKGLRLFLTSAVPKPRNPKKAVLICHVPPRFRGLEAIDVARFGVVEKDFFLKERGKVHFYPADPKGEKIIIQEEAAKRLMKKKAPVKILVKNRGSLEVTKLMKKLKLEKYLGGHFHESGGKACDGKGRKVQNRKWSEELYVNASMASSKKGAIVSLKEEKAKCEFVRVK